MAAGRYDQRTSGALHDSPHIRSKVITERCELRVVAKDNAHHFNDEVLETVRTNSYVDDCLKSVNSVEEARKLIHDLIELLKLGRFQLKKWLSNESSVLSQVDISDRAHTDLNLDLNRKTTLVSNGIL